MSLTNWVDNAYRPTARIDGVVYFQNITAYDGHDNPLQRYTYNGLQTYAYDALDRLTSATDPQAGGYGALSYSYDGNGNRLTETRQGATMNYSYLPAESNRLLLIGGSELRLHDNAGQTYYLSTLGFLGYDGYGQLVTAGTGTYDYNAWRQRIRKTAGGATSFFHYGPSGELLYETDGVNTKVYVHFEGVPLARVDNDTNVYYYHTDHLGTPQAMTDSAGNLVWKASYEPLGKATVNEDPDGDGVLVRNNVRYAGQYFDSETGLYYSWNNYYDPITGRWITPDKMSVVEHVLRWRARMGIPGQPPLEINPYVRVLNNPLRWIDRTGFETTAMWGGDPFYELPDSPPYTLPAPVDPNGNYRPGFSEQDAICTLPGIIGQAANANPCVLDCCKAHDDCYARNRCNASSWRGNFLGENMACQQCNAEARHCVASAISNGCSSCSK